MKRAALFAIMALFLAAIAIAQDNTGNNSTSSESKHSKLELRTLVGCLSRTADTYVITGGAPGPKQFRIVGGDDLTGEICTKWNERESTWRKSGSCPSRGTSQSRS